VVLSETRLQRVVKPFRGLRSSILGRSGRSIFAAGQWRTLRPGFSTHSTGCGSSMCAN